ncbi:MAG: hypothetical protein NTW37_15825 [Proteobacteria bacterium]|nr:hypothetical protein [Pseudomonadota bacterium]
MRSLRSTSIPRFDTSSALPAPRPAMRSVFHCMPKALPASVAWPLPADTRIACAPLPTTSSGIARLDTTCRP